MEESIRQVEELKKCVYSYYRDLTRAYMLINVLQEDNGVVVGEFIAFEMGGKSYLKEYTYAKVMSLIPITYNQFRGFIWGY